MTSSDQLKQLARDIASNLCEWMAEGEQQAQSAQDDEPYWDHLHGKIGDYLDMAYSLGLRDAASQHPKCQRCRGTGKIYRLSKTDYYTCNACKGKEF